jgi:hypothetical protein
MAYKYKIGQVMRVKKSPEVPAYIGKIGIIYAHEEYHSPYVYRVSFKDKYPSSKDEEDGTHSYIFSVREIEPVTHNQKEMIYYYKVNP